ncbi:DUF664 domain-containing protein [Kribbella sp. NPDC058245]|uniref:mycothiol transferase n=1 Tax=Kribbella sp. NPDC058245 TaxID=3346399 RepID=UPI0036EA3AC2
MNLYEARPPIVADERTQLIGWLDLQRLLVRRKLEGLRVEDEHRAVFPDSPLMTPAGLVSHLRWMEHLWFEVVYLNAPEAENPAFRKDVENAEMHVDGVPLAQLLDEFDAQWKRSNEIVAGAESLDDLGRQTDFVPNLRWIVIHMVEETARHVGQLDTMRELLDGQKGYY